MSSHRLLPSSLDPLGLLDGRFRIFHWFALWSPATAASNSFIRLFCPSAAEQSDHESIEADRAPDQESSDSKTGIHDFH
jgi:hypothetical protein